MGTPKEKKPRNYELGGTGVMRFSRSRMYKKRALHRKSIKESRKAKKPEKPKVEKTIKKDIGGEKNGGSRVISKKKTPRFYPTEERPRRLPTRKLPFSKHKRSLKSSITPGTVLILLAGRHKGKRVVFLKQLASGFLLVNGPYHINGCPLRRVNQIYTIATRTKLDISDLKIDDRLNDDYFKRQKLKRPKHTEGEIFDTQKEKYTVSEDRKKDQKDMDKQMLDVIRKHPEKKLMMKYLSSLFGLTNRMYPHKMSF